MPYKYIEIERKLKKLWYEIIRQKGSHVLFSKWKSTIVVPKNWNKDVSNWVENIIIKKLWLNWDSFRNI